MKYENGWFINIIEYYNSKLKEYKVNYSVDTSDFVSPDDFDGVELSCFGMIINDKKCVLCKKKTFGYVTQNMPSGMIGLIDFYLTLFHALI